MKKYNMHFLVFVTVPNLKHIDNSYSNVYQRKKWEDLGLFQISLKDHPILGN